MSLRTLGTLVELLMMLYFLFNFIVRQGRLRRFLWKLALYLVLLVPGAAMLSVEPKTAAEADVSVAVGASLIVSASMWIVLFDPGVSRVFTLAQLGTLALSVAFSLAILLGLRDRDGGMGGGGGGGRAGTSDWEERKVHLLRVPGVVWAFALRLPREGPRVAAAFGRLLAVSLVLRYRLGEGAVAGGRYYYYHPSGELGWLNRTVYVNGTGLALDAVR